MAKARVKTSSVKRSPTRKATPSTRVATRSRWVPPPSLAPPGAVDRIRTLCLSFPATTERLSHGAVCFFAGPKAFAKISDNHHSDGRFALIVAAPPGAQAMLVEAEPDHYYEPPYVRHLGWVGMRLDQDIAWSSVEALVESAYLEVVPAKIAAQVRRQNTID
jgi:hypothetical protein